MTEQSKRWGVLETRNSRFRRRMEDTHVAFEDFNGDPFQRFFGIYDGHGGVGAAEFAKEHLHDIFIKELSKGSDLIQIWTSTYSLLDLGLKEANIIQPGATAVNCFIRKENENLHLYTANIGDARAVLNRNGTAIRLTRDHKASDEDEIERIESAGGFVSEGRVLRMFAISRSFGDMAVKEYIINEPFTSHYQLESEDKFIIIACDGVWDVFSDQEAVDLIKEMSDPDLMAKEILVNSLQRGSMDNITVLVVLIFFHFFQLNLDKVEEKEESIKFR